MHAEVAVHHIHIVSLVFGGEYVIGILVWYSRNFCDMDDIQCNPSLSRPNSRDVYRVWCV